jgi:hypothetical protein
MIGKLKKQFLVKVSTSKLNAICYFDEVKTLGQQISCNSEGIE